MARGKRTCRILKDIRRQIAEANDIELVISECSFKGDCLGTCPKCESEVRYLEEQLHLRAMAGKVITLAGISASFMLMAGCGSESSERQSDFAPEEKAEVNPAELIGDFGTPVDEVSSDTMIYSIPESDEIDTEGVVVMLGRDPHRVESIEYPDNEASEDNIENAIDNTPDTIPSSS